MHPTIVAELARATNQDRYRDVDIRIQHHLAARPRRPVAPPSVCATEH